MYVFNALAGAECFLLPVMAFDHYVAICSPLLYMVVDFGKHSLIPGRSDSSQLLQWTKFQVASFVNGIKKLSVTSRLLKVVSKSELNVVYLREMDQKDITAVPEFILMGLTELAEFQTLHFLVLLAVYLISLLVRTISLIERAMQIYLFVACVTTEDYLLVVMAYECFMAICNPLLYAVVMSPRVCTQFRLCSYLIGFLQGLIQVLLIFHLPFCKSNIINHFFCDLSPILKLLCSNTFPSEVLLFRLGLFNGTLTSLEIVVSYVYILITTLKICSATGRPKAFSTCVSHLTMVGLLYGTTIFINIRPSSQYTPENDKVVFMFYTPVMLMLNPLISSLRKKDVKDTL
ncbi:olfactory receptor 154-like [Tachyglossus aculeatus]|uniref:olfactory receptor 154-like n=1 Tax=Tachyglossus aculeatus TaxID=9261 RepID=UPI0018F38046|nr:olfactory receptor 154-like [Tachyglossus aculeatus]